MKSVSIVRRTKKEKIAASAAAMAIQMAKDNNDPLYNKLIKYKRLWKSTKDRILEKYLSRTMPKARQKSAQ